MRWAQQIIEGIRNGQSLGALLGYRLERALHDEPTLFLDRADLRVPPRVPAGGQPQHVNPRWPDLDEITKVEARNVVDGAAFVDHVAKTGSDDLPLRAHRPAGLERPRQPGSPPAAEIGAIVDRCVTDMRRVADAVADLGVAEGVYQVVRGNYDRAAGTLDAFSKGTHPPHARGHGDAAQRPIAHAPRRAAPAGRAAAGRSVEHDAAREG